MDYIDSTSFFEINPHFKVTRKIVFGETILIEGLPIADRNSPLLPDYYFRQLIDQIGGIDFSTAL